MRMFVDYDGDESLVEHIVSGQRFVEMSAVLGMLMTSTVVYYIYVLVPFHNNVD